MKKTKIFVSLMLTLVMVLAMAIPAFAANTPTTGTITITNPLENQDYKIYKMFDLSVNSDKSAFSYTVDGTWKPFVEGEVGEKYFKIESKDGVDYVSLKDGVTVDSNSAAANEIAKAALEFATTTNGINPVATLPNTGDGVTDENKYVASGLPLGYYLVDSSVGALCGLTTNHNDVTVNEKNDAPTVDKVILVPGSDPAKSNTVKIGDAVNYQTTIKVKVGAKNYILHDTMDTGLTLDKNSFVVKVDNAVVPETETVEGNERRNYTIKTTDTKDANCTFEIVFTDEYLNVLAKDLKKATDTTAEITKDIVVTYTANLNENAVIAGEGNKNKTWLTYGDKNTKTEESVTTTYTYQFDLVKTDKDNKVIDGAKFELYASKNGDDKIAIVKESDGVYHVASKAEKEAEGGFTPDVIDAGKATIKGLGTGTYYLKETQQPDGYNKLAERFEFTIGTDNLVAAYTDDTEKVYSPTTGSAVQVVNYAGTELPSTGGVGTTIFYIVGGILLVGAGLALVVRRRMNAK